MIDIVPSGDRHAGIPGSRKTFIGIVTEDSYLLLSMRVIIEFFFDNVYAVVLTGIIYKNIFDILQRLPQQRSDTPSYERRYIKDWDDYGYHGC